MAMDDIKTRVMQLQSKPVPRHLRFRFSTLFGPVILICIIFAAITIAFRVNFLRTVNLFFGWEARAEVYGSKTWVTPGKVTTTNDGLYISYPYPEKTYNALVPADYKTGQSPKNGDIIKIRYVFFLHDYPYINDIGDIMCAVAIVITILIALMNLLPKILTSYGMLKNGSPVIGTVLGSGYGGRYTNAYTIVSYEWQNQHVEKKFKVHAGSEKDQLLILVDPLDPKKSAIYDKKYYWKLADDIS